MELNIQGKKALITGGSKGIGKAIKEELLKEGVIVYDFSRSTDVDLMTDIGLNFAKSYMYKFDILINNVGGGGTWHPDCWRDVMEKNFGITTELTREFIKNKKWGRVITISSIYGKEKGDNPYFTASKSAQISLMKSLAGKVKNITFNTICPGHIDVGKEFPDNPKIIGKPEDISGLVTFLCSDKASHINGACITIDGGMSHSF